MKNILRVNLILLLINFGNVIAQSEKNSPSFILTTNDEKISIKPGYPLYHDRGITQVYCRLPKESDEPESFKLYFTTKTQGIKKIVDGERTYIPVILKKKKKKNKNKIVLGRIIAKKGNLTLLTFNYMGSGFGAGSTTISDNSQFIIINEDNVILEKGGIMNNYYLKEEERNLVIDENAMTLHKYFGDCLNRSHLELFDFFELDAWSEAKAFVKPKIVTQKVPFLLWKNNNIECD